MIHDERHPLGRASRQMAFDCRHVDRKRVHRKFLGERGLMRRSSLCSRRQLLLSTN